jgi:hypothetical protein
LRKGEKSVIPGKRLDDPGITFDSVKYYFIERIRDSIDEIVFDQIYILSFSAEEDDLSQWRGYCPNGNGFSMGFNTDLLKQIMKKIYFDRCIYEKYNQEDKIKTIIDKWLVKLETEFGSSENKEDTVEKLMMEAIIVLLHVIPQIKDIAFKDEKEWRFIYIKTNGPVKFKTGKSMLVPYLEVPLAEEKNADGKWGPIKILDSVIVGPTPHGKLSKRSVEEMLKANGITLRSDDISGCEVKLSKIPYRIL